MSITCCSARSPAPPRNMGSMGKATISAKKGLASLLLPIFHVWWSVIFFTIIIVQLISSNTQILFHSVICITVLVQIHKQLFTSWSRYFPSSQGKVIHLPFFCCRTNLIVSHMSLCWMAWECRRLCITLEFNKVWTDLWMNGMLRHNTKHSPQYSPKSISLKSLPFLSCLIKKKHPIASSKTLEFFWSIKIPRQLPPTSWI